MICAGSGTWCCGSGGGGEGWELCPALKSSGQAWLMQGGVLVLVLG